MISLHCTDTFQWSWLWLDWKSTYSHYALFSLLRLYFILYIYSLFMWIMWIVCKDNYCFGWYAWTPILTMWIHSLISFLYIYSLYFIVFGLHCTALHGHVSMYLICINMCFGGIFVRMWWVESACNEHLSDAKKVLIDEELFDGLCDKWNHHWNKLTYCLGIELLLIQCMGNVGR